MKKWNTIPESSFLKGFFVLASLCFLAAAWFFPDRGQALSGLGKILTQPCKAPTNYFQVGGVAATFLNMGLVGLFCVGLCLLPGAKANNATTLGFFLTLGFSAWGIHPLNMLPTVLGVALYCLVKKEKLGQQVNAMLFSTGIAPLISEMLFRYPGTEAVGFHTGGVLAALAVGLVIGFFLPAGLAYAPNIHKGFNHYSAAVPIGFTAFFLRVVLYNILLGQKVGDLGSLSVVSAPEMTAGFGVNLFCMILFGGCILSASLMGCKLQDYWKLMKNPGKGISFTEKYGNGPFLMNMGVFGLMILACFNLAGWADGKEIWTSMTFGVVFCMVCTGNSGAHPGNILPIMAGYWVAAYLFGWLFRLMGGESYGLTIGSQGILIGLCFAGGLSPIAGKYGFGWGMLAAALHYLLVTAVPDLHGGLCLYNGGLTAALVCLLLVPQLEKFCKTKEEKTCVGRNRL